MLGKYYFINLCVSPIYEAGQKDSQVHSYNENLQSTFLKMLKCNFAMFSIWQASTWLICKILREEQQDLVGAVRPELPGLEGQVGEPEGGEAEDSKVHRLIGLDKIRIGFIRID